MDRNEFAAIARLEAFYAHMTLEEFSEAAPILATEPGHVKAGFGVLYESEAKAVLDFGNGAGGLGTRHMARLPPAGAA